MKNLNITKYDFSFLIVFVCKMAAVNRTEVECAGDNMVVPHTLCLLIHLHSYVDRIQKHLYAGYGVKKKQTKKASELNI